MSWLEGLPGRLAVILAMVCLSACVTTVVGGPQPASKDTRLKAQLDLARGYLEQSNWSRAKEPLTRALEIEPQSVEVLVLWAYLYQNEYEYGLAEQSFRKAMRYGPRDPQVLNNYGTFLYQQQRYDEAIKLLSRAADDANYAQRSQSYENLGLAYLRAGDETAAEKAFLRSVNLNPRQTRASLELAVINYGRGNISRSRTHYEAFRSQARQTQRSLCLGYQLAEASGDQDQAASYQMVLKNMYAQSTDCRVE